MTQIKKEMSIGEIIQKNPCAAEVMFKYGLHCIGCHISLSETLEQGAAAHGLSGKDIDKMVGEINEAGRDKSCECGCSPADNCCEPEEKAEAKKETKKKSAKK